MQDPAFIDLSLHLLFSIKIWVPHTWCLRIRACLEFQEQAFFYSSELISLIKAINVG
jgi:hypothetical protein